ncbi:hypothetical protein B5G06_08915 [Flavonifractor sp. An52]|uniref:S-layer homology domain-containing protein n=1 Tax=Flavonifractor sp. An52 TaxID=1965642 RepID=UPI000B3B079C|nr:S-layer homology domain-containing protein [Flavonifractor sp. An52]OUN82867.1 hypothetical protein B5G06_08915 [Flavonifractor sp. An52]
MRHWLKRAGSGLLALLLAVQLLPGSVLAVSSFEGTASGTELFKGEADEPRLFVSETAYPLAPGVTEYVTYTNERSGLNQNIDFFCEIDLDQAEIMAGYANLEGILTDQEITWRMQTVSDQAKSAQSYFARSEDYADATIVAALNADYYNMATGQPSGILMIDGVIYNQPSSSYYFAIDQNGDALISNDTSEAFLATLRHAVAGGTLLVKDGAVNVQPGGRNVTYTAIGIKADGTVVSMVCYGQRYPVSCGYTQYEVAQMMKARGCVTALMLDGSGSSTFVSRREGDSQITTRNNPSDGQERQVSSSIFILSRVKADGVFDHAALSPANEVYTPGSTVQFTAVGADKSGGPAPLPDGTYWSVASGYGTIDSGTGRFTSNGTEGDVTVYLNSGAEVVGQTTITIAHPDQITFAEETASIGQGDTSDLGLRVYYQQREVHYKDGDFTWTIEPTQYTRRQWVGPDENDYETVVETVESSPDQMQYLTLGTVNNNRLTCDPVYTGANLKQPDHTLTDSEKTASAITARVTVTSKADNSIFGTVTVDACKDPIVAMDFESENTTVFHSFETYAGQFDENGTYTAFETAKTQEEIAAEGYGYTCVSYAGRTTDGRQVGKAEIVSKADGYPVRFGEHSMRVDYDFSTNAGKTDGACFGAVEDIELANLGNPTRIGIWVYIPKNTPNLWLRLQYRDGSGNASQLDFTENDIYRPNNVARNADDNWHYFEADISKLQTPVTIPAGQTVRVMMANPKQSIGAAKLWASPVGWVKCQTDENGNIILVDKDDPRVASFTGGYTTTPLDIGAVVPDTVTLGTTGETVTIDQVPIPEYLATFDSSGNNLSKGNLSGTLYFDNITFIYGSTPEDTSAPDIESITVKAGGGDAVNLTSGMTLASGALDIEAFFNDSTETDRNNTGVASASLYVDNRLVEGDGVIVGADTLRAGIRLANGSHTIRISVVDNYGNEATRTFTVTVADPEGDGAPVEVTAQETTAVLGGQIHLDFTPRDNSVDSMTVTLDVPRAYADGYQITPAASCEVSSMSYNSTAEELTFTVTGSVNSGSMATLTLNVPAGAATGTTLTIPVNGQAGGSTFNATPSWTVTAPYTVTSGQMVAGLADTCWFQISHTASGEPASGVTLYAGSAELGTSGADGRVSCEPKEGTTSLTVTAQDTEGGVSAEYVAPVYWPQGNTDGTPTRVWRNAADAADTLNVSWLANPLYAGSSACIQIAESEEALETAEPQSADCDLVTFSGGNAAAYVCGAEVTGLTPGRTYYYRVGDGEHWSEASSFTTVYENTGISALVMGDLQENDNANLSGILEQAGVDGLDLAIQTGDLVDNGSSYSYWNNTMGMLESLTMDRLFAVGNHEQEGGIDPHTVIYNQDNSSYYSMKVGNVFVATIAYNSFSDAALDQLVADAQASGATWKLLVTHQPPYYTNVTAGMGSSAQQAIVEAVQEAGIDVVLSGHDHAYARTQPMLDGQVVSPETGITYFICGSLGEKSYGVTDTPEFHFAKATNDYQALYLTLDTTDSELTIQVYDYNNGSPELMDSFTKTKGSGSHTHSYTWNGSDQLTCSCGYTIPAASYTGYAAYTNASGKSGQVYLNAGKLMTGWFAVGEDTLHHAGDDGLLHDAESINTAQCWENGNLICWCHDCNKYRTFSETRRQGHLYNEDHVCTRQVFNMETWEYETCGLHGKDISTLDIELAYQYGYYTGEPRRPAVTVTDPETGYELFGQSTYGDYMPYWENNVNVGTATVRIVGYSDGPYYGEVSVNYQVVPQDLTAEDFTYTATSNSVRLTWESAPGAQQYIVYQNVGGTWTRRGIVDEPEFTFTGLSAGEHQFRVRPFATVDGQDYYSSRNSDIVTVTIAGGGVTFQDSGENGVLTRTYGDAAFANPASAEGASASFTYTSADTNVATVDAAGTVTIVGAGSTVITATAGELSGQYRLTVQPKEVTLTWTGTEERVYDGQPSSVTAQAGGLMEDDAVTVTVTGGGQKNAGTHTAAASDLSSGNYALPEDCTAEYVITPATITALEWSSEELTYTGQPIAPTATAKEGLVEGDEVTFSVPEATEPGTYQVTAVSQNPNYVVAADVTPHQFTIVLPTITLSKTDGSVTAHMDGTSIMLSGLVGSPEETITVTVSGGGQSGSATVSSGETGTVTLSGVTYGVDAGGLAVKPTDVTLTNGKTDVVPPAEGVTADLEDAQKEEMNTAANSVDNKFTNILAAIASAVEEIVEDALDKVEGEVSSVKMEVSQRLEVKEYTPGESYKVDITPVYQIVPDAKDGEEAGGEPGPSAGPIASGTLSNDQITAPVEVSIQVPSDITLTEGTTFVRHHRSDGRWEYIRPTTIKDHVLTFWTSSFSEFEVVSDNRTGSVTFPLDDGDQTRVFTPADLGTELPKLAQEGYTFNGWTIGGDTYTEVNEYFLDALKSGETLVATASFTENEKPVEPDDPDDDHGGGGGGAVSTDHSVTAAGTTHGTISLSADAAAKGETVTITVKPANGYELDILTVTDASGKAVATTDLGNGRYSFTMPGSKVTVEAGFKPVEEEPTPVELPFTDVAESAWYYDAVAYAYANGLMDGTGASSFAPGMTTNRAMLATLLYRLEKEPAVSGAVSFQDVAAGQWYTDAVAWAASEGIVNGVGDGSAFAPNDTITREQMAVMLYRYAQYKGYDVSQGGMAAQEYSDYGQVASWAQQAMQWAVSAGLITGTSDTTLSPQGSASRAEIATILMRFCENVVK